MNSIISMTPQQLRRAADIQERILALQRELNSLTGAAISAPAPAAAKPKKGKISAAGLARIRAAQRARWAKVKRAGGKAATGKPRRKMSAAGRARLAALARARWAKVKAAGKKRL